MIDIENKVFDTVYNAVIAVEPNAVVLADTAEQIAVFPVVTLNEVNNSTYTRTMVNANEEQHAQITYEVNVYCDNQSGHKTKCKQLLGAVDSAMAEMRFTRKLVTRLPNIDRTIYRMYARYVAIVSKPVTDDDGTDVYSIYRR